MIPEPVALLEPALEELLGRLRDLLNVLEGDPAFGFILEVGSTHLLQ